MQILRDERRSFVARVMAEAAAKGPLPYGWRAALARFLGVNRSTLTRDVQALMAGPPCRE